MYGTSYDDDGVHGEVNNSKSAVAGVNQGSGYGLYGSASGDYATGVYGGGGTAGTGVYGTAEADPYGDGATGVWGTATGYDYGTGVYGFANSDYGTGVMGQCSGTGCVAVYAAGDLDYTGGLNHLSDIRLKRDIVPLKGSLDKLEELKPVSFYWKDPSQHGDAKGIQRGFIAQDYEKVFPEWVKADKDGFKMIDTTGLDAMEVESIRQLKSENDELKARLDRLETSRKVVVAGNSWGFAGGALILGFAMVITQRKKKDEDEPKKGEKKKGA